MPSALTSSAPETPPAGSTTSEGTAPRGPVLEYANPILDADWPDPDAIQVGGRYYLVASSFNRVPGLPLLRSDDLVHWEPIGHALPRLVPEEHFRLPRHGGGVWAPSIRHHAGRFWIFYPDPDHGIYVLSAEAAEGPWTEPHLLLAGRGLIDPCPLWVSDGGAYLVHGWARSRAGIKNRLTVHRMAPDATRVLDAGTVVVDGDAIGITTLEGPKFYEHGGHYWIFAPSGGVETGVQDVFRAAGPFGPYERRTVLASGRSPVNGPHQGAWVRSPEGLDWFLHFQDRGPYGRVVHLQPMSWDDDGWPRVGTAALDPSLEGPGEPVAGHHVPVPALSADPGPTVTHDGGVPAGVVRGTGTGLDPAWHWQANPTPDGPPWASAGEGGITLAALPNDPVNLRELPNVLSRVIPGQPCTFTVELSLGEAPSGTRAGVVVLGRRYAWLGLADDGAGCRVRAGVGGEGRAEEDPAAPQREEASLAARSLHVRVACGADGRARFSWRADTSEPWREEAWEFEIREGDWIGAELGVFAVAPLGGPAAEARVTSAELAGA